jgi:putative transposase
MDEKKIRKGKSRLTEGKKNIIEALLQEYDLETTEDIQDALKDLLGGTIEKMLQAEMDNHLGYEPYERSEEENSRNGVKSKKVRSNYGELNLAIPQDRNSSFEPKLVPKRKKEINEIEGKIIRMYARGLTTRQISEQIEDIYGFEVSEGFVSDVTDKMLPVIEEWQNLPLSEIYPIVFIDAIHFSVKENNIIKKLAAYIVLGINSEGKKEVLTIQIGDNESSKFWLGVLNELKNRGVRDILVLCADGLAGLKESVMAAFPNTEYQRCIVHQVRNTLKHVASGDMKEFAKDLKSIYHASTEEKAQENLTKVTDKWSEKYPYAMKSWSANWDVISPIFKFSADVRKVIYTTNAIESLNSTYRRLNRSRSVYPSKTSLLKSLYFSTLEAVKKWTMPVRNWANVYGEFSIMYEGRM